MRYRSVALGVVAGLISFACGTPSATEPTEPTVRTERPAPVVGVPGDAAIADARAVPPPGMYADLAGVLVEIIPADARVIGLGELHNRVDRAAVRSALAVFTAALPSIGDRLSDLIVETWIVDPNCGKTAVAATQKMETEVKRPEATKSEIALLAEAAKAAKVQPHAMKLSCADYKTLVPNGEVDALAMLTLTTRELKRIAISAVVHRDKDPAHRPWIAVYGGALHNDRFPDKAIAEWSYAAAVDKVSKDRYVEIDLIVPELAAADSVSRKQPWYSLVETAGDWVQVWKRGDRSFVVILAKTR
ncbi:MAG: hypothetical protein H0T42_01535 [Deltaproteobacteria bacterium]|nr:hypothetical protein [Deltaproteobacteria bacterium]